MSKIPVGQTIKAAYRFAFVDLERVIGLIWLPVIVLTVADYFVNGSVLSARAAAMNAGDMAQLGPVLAGQFGFLFIALLLKAMIAVAIGREILKPLQRPVWLRFSLGGAEFRFVGTMLAIALMGGLVAVVLMVAGGALSGAVPMAGIAPGQKILAMAGLLAFVLSPGLIYLFVRLVSLALPSVVVDGGLGLERSWQLLKGNVFRMLIVSLAVTLPVLIVFMVGYVAIVGPEVFNPHLELAGDAAAQMRHQAEVLRQTATRLPLLEGLQFILAPFLYGLTFAAPAYAFKALTGDVPPPVA